MAIARDFLIWLSTKPSLTRPIATTGMRLGFARRFIAGETVEEALRVAQELNGRGLLVVMNQLGEHVNSTAEVEASGAAYERLLREMAARKIVGTITVKPTQLGLEIAPELCRDLTCRLAAQAQAMGTWVEIDMEHSAVSGATVDLFEHVRSAYPNVGLAVQSYLRRTAADLKRLEPYHPKIRLVKGAYNEPAEVAFQEKREVDEIMPISWVPCSRTVLSRGRDPTELLDRAKALARERGLHPDQWEVQMLFRVRRDLQEKLVREGSNACLRVLRNRVGPVFHGAARRAPRQCRVRRKKPSERKIKGLPDSHLAEPQTRKCSPRGWSRSPPPGASGRAPRLKSCNLEGRCPHETLPAQPSKFHRRSALQGAVLFILVFAVVWGVTYGISMASPATAASGPGAVTPEAGSPVASPEPQPVPPRGSASRGACGPWSAP
jgi:proline dehydrogenase